jgi:hypothetical protein
MAAKDSTAEPLAGARETRRGDLPRINWDDSNMRSIYANVCNAQSTREEFVLYFGISNPQSGGDQGQGEIVVQLSDRVIMSPFAAKRLCMLLNNVLEQYESRYGSLAAGSATPSGSGAQAQN